MTAKKVNTKLAQQLVEADKPNHKKTQSNNQKATKPKGEAEDEGGPHVDASKPAKAILGKDSQYAHNGHKYLKGQQGRGVYQNVNHPYFVHIKDLVADHCKFPDGNRPENFDPSYGQSWPYMYQAHHILPAESFFCKTSKGPIFSSEQMTLLLKTDYDINNGHNIIMLPALNEHVCVHMLMQHRGSHGQYSAMVIKGLKKLADKLQKIVDKKKEHEDVTIDLAKELEKMEDAYWNWIVKVSRSVIAKVAGSIQYEYDPIKFRTATKKRPWGSLA